jgi:hypothetical protein
MLVNLSYTVVNPFHTYEHIVPDDKSFENISRYKTRCRNMSKYLKSLRYSKDFQMFNHFRINPKIPKFDYMDFSQYMDTQNNLGDVFNVHACSLSMHAHFSFNYFRMKDLRKLKNYFKLCMLFKQSYALKKFYICNHLKYNNVNECIAIIQGITEQIGGLDESFCIENCDRFADLIDCLKVCERTNQPLIYDNFHNSLNGNYNLENYAKAIVSTWEESKSVPIVHYSRGERNGKHGYFIDTQQLLDMLNCFSQYTDKIIVIVELKNAREEIFNFRERTLNSLDWNNDMSFYI